MRTKILLTEAVSIAGFGLAVLAPQLGIPLKFLTAARLAGITVGVSSLNITSELQLRAFEKAMKEKYGL